MYRSNTASSTGYLMLNVFQAASDGTVCNESVSDVIEIAPWKVRYGMHYVHTNIAVGGGVSLTVSGSGIGTWNSKAVATMIADAGCPWTGYHAHVSAVPVALSYYSENRAVYPCCDYGGGYYPNNSEGYRTHRMQFWQGH
jgi:hypothetical protein